MRSMPLIVLFWMIIMNDVDGYQGYTLNLKQSVPVPLMETVKVLNKEPNRREILQLNTSGKVNFSHVSEFVRDMSVNLSGTLNI